MESPGSSAASPPGHVGGSVLQLCRCCHGLEARPWCLIHEANIRHSTTEKGPEKGLLPVTKGNEANSGKLAL